MSTSTVEDEMIAFLKHEKRSRKDITTHHIPNEGIKVSNVEEVRASSGPVDRFTGSFQAVQEQTAQRCLRLAEALEAEATKLKQYAAILVQQGKQIPEDIKRATAYEIDVRRRVEYWSPVVKSDE